MLRVAVASVRRCGVARMGRRLLPTTVAGVPRLDFSYLVCVMRGVFGRHSTFFLCFPGSVGTGSLVGLKLKSCRFAQRARGFNMRPMLPNWPKSEIEGGGERG